MSLASFDINADSFEDVRRYVRGRLLERTNRRQDGTVTADDVHTVIDSLGFGYGNDKPRTRRERIRARRRVIASLLNSNSTDFQSWGDTTPSRRPEARGRRIVVWERV